MYSAIDHDGSSMSLVGQDGFCICLKQIMQSVSNLEIMIVLMNKMLSHNKFSPTSTWQVIPFTYYYRIWLKLY